jgi:hypothetical protein
LLDTIGAYELARIEVDMSKHIKKIRSVRIPSNKSPRKAPIKSPPKRARRKRIVKLDLVITIEGRQLKFEARWPSGAKTEEDIKVREIGYVSLAPSLMPGAV